MTHPSRTIGLLGGSFNPAHAGHLRISEEALKRLQLDEVWWLVSPRNPLKNPANLASYQQRLHSAQHMAAGNPRIRVTSLETRLATPYTIDTLKALKRRSRGIRFVWLMGADNLAQFQRWKAWEQIFRTVPIAVFDRAPYSHHALRTKASQHFANQRISSKNITTLARQQPPAWCYVLIPRHPASSTALRKTLGESAFLAHNGS